MPVIHFVNGGTTFQRTSQRIASTTPMTASQRRWEDDDDECKKGHMRKNMDTFAASVNIPNRTRDGRSGTNTQTHIRIIPKRIGVFVVRVAVDNPPAAAWWRQ